MLVYHPLPDEHGKPVLLKSPSKATPLACWNQVDAVATVTPGGQMPSSLNGIKFDDWHDVPTSHEAWNNVEGQCCFEEPAFCPPQGKMPAAGVVVEEADGRFWLVAPSNGFGGYLATFPKGRIEGKVSRQASAIREAYEEAGLKVRITGFLADSDRTQSYTRYYLAQRVGGNPALMGWESQAVHLVPRLALRFFLTHTKDQPLLKAIIG
ncbi:NUDIX hydrolase|uniref:NUDIX hydrolase n=1 Tax=Noviherbaspirillum sp. L7-7A TaxID=2850560 RepID=UPI001C2BECA8|nr:NUDIX hydrolase [Noviherbaspirillum sp. L7-7A]MBV0881048.1 NUDIX hydrolase [Noviherbaspirillum sp. L7-7A]